MKVIIKGKASEGKTTISLLIFKMLNELGFDITYKGFDETDIMIRRLLNNENNIHTEKLNNIRNREIIIEEIRGSAGDIISKRELKSNE